MLRKYKYWRERDEKSQIGHTDRIRTGETDAEKILRMGEKQMVRK